MEGYFKFQGCSCQNYHIFTPPERSRLGHGRGGCQHLDTANSVCKPRLSYTFKEARAAILWLEFWITPFDYAPYEGPGPGRIESKLEENKLIGLSWAVLDYVYGEGRL